MQTIEIKPEEVKKVTEDCLEVLRKIESYLGIDLISLNKSEAAAGSIVDTEPATAAISNHDKEDT
ncbi:hypothetical protein CMI42_00365 [Candidatus Pacearchaeota archaeon]|nr:hypothetical protein [Candidatus Pacearchaeota archaeon]|tara:strand:+ start:334 stop:528 length:195 start_codon:yes stop_codon:yes gene_type:complete